MANNKDKVLLISDSPTGLGLRHGDICLTMVKEDIYMCDPLKDIADFPFRGVQFDSVRVELSLIKPSHIDWLNLANRMRKDIESRKAKASCPGHASHIHMQAQKFFQNSPTSIPAAHVNYGVFGAKAPSKPKQASVYLQNIKVGDLLTRLIDGHGVTKYSTYEVLSVGVMHGDPFARIEDDDGCTVYASLLRSDWAVKFSQDPNCFATPDAMKKAQKEAIAKFGPGYKMELKPGMKEYSADLSECNHKFVEYQGLIRSFKYCVHCDEKEKI